MKPPWSRIRSKEARSPSTSLRDGLRYGNTCHNDPLHPGTGGGTLKRRGLSVLDVGTGSGILSIVAAKLGAREVWGIDIDGVAVENARENVEKNHVSDIVKIRKGSIGDLHKKFDVIVANIDLKSLRRMRRPLLSHLNDRGLLILSGILEEEKERTPQALPGDRTPTMDQRDSRRRVGLSYL